MPELLGWQAFFEYFLGWQMKQKIYWTEIARYRNIIHCLLYIYIYTYAICIFNFNDFHLFPLQDITSMMVSALLQVAR